MSKLRERQTIIIDAGNTRVRWARWESTSALSAQVELHTLAPLAGLGEMRAAQAVQGEEFIASMSESFSAADKTELVLTSVVPQLDSLVREAWPFVRVVNHRCELPFGLALDEPAAVGADRLCNIAAAAACGWARALVVDMGTATTFDLLLDGEFVGGLIAPGMGFAAACLGREAAQLPTVPFVRCALVPGSNTAAAMQAGAYHVGRGGVEAVIVALCQQYGPLPVVLTGGLGAELAGPDRLLDPDWTLRGAAVLAGLA